MAGLYAVLVAFSALTAFSVTSLLTPTKRYGVLKAAVGWGGLPLLLAAGAYASWNLEPDYGTTLPLAIVFGVCAGTWAAAAILPRKRAVPDLEDRLGPD